MTLDRIYCLTPQAAELSRQLRLCPIEWRCLRALSSLSLRTGLELAKELKITPAGLIPILDKLRQDGLIHEPLLSWTEYLATNQAEEAWEIGSVVVKESSPPTEEVKPISFTLGREATVPTVPPPLLSLTEYLANGKTEEVKAIPPVAEKPTPSEGASPITLTLSRAVPAPTTYFAPLPSKNPPAATSLPLKPLLRFVHQRAGEGSIGQLAVYRVFLLIPLHLLEKSGLDDIDFETTEAVIYDSELISAFHHAVREVVGEPYVEKASPTL